MRIKEKKTQNDNPQKSISFFKFILQKEQLFDILITFTLCLLAYLGIRYCYPYPLTFIDSNGYLDAAVKNQFYVYRPFGYSFFLQILHSINNSIHLIFIVQTFLLFLATSFLAISVKYFYAPAKKWLWYIALLFLIFTPTSFVMANWILSDLLFSVQIYLMITLFMFIINRNDWIAALLFVLVLFTAFHVRYSATIFPFMFIPFFLMKKGKLRWFLSLATLLVFFVFYFQTKESMKKTVKIDQFSTGFDGWHYLNNTLFVLPHIDYETMDVKNPKLKKLHSFVIDEVEIIQSITENSKRISSVFTWGNKLPLKQYLYVTIQEQNASYLPTFVKVGSGEYKGYAMYIITHYPLLFFQHYYLPNLIQTLYPSPGCITEGFHRDKLIYEYYQIDTENPLQAKYYPLNSDKYHSTIQYLHLLMWGIIVCIGITAILKKKRIFFSTNDKIVFWGVFSFAAIYYGTSVFAAPMEIRYTIGMHSIQFVFCYFLLNKLFGGVQPAEKENLEIKKVNKKQKKNSRIIYILFFSIVGVSAGGYFIFSNKTPKNLKSFSIKKWEELTESKMNDYVEACKFCENNLPDSILVVTRKPEIFKEYSDKKSITFPWNAEPDSMMLYLKNNSATHVILDERYHYSYVTLYPAVQKYPEKFKVIHVIGVTDTVSKRKPTYVLEYNDLWGYFGERVDGKKTGEGYEVFQDGRKYVGQFENNLPNGFGTLYDPHGKVIVKGKWQNGAFVGN